MNTEELITKVAERAVELNPSLDKETIEMDLKVVIESGVELRLEDMLEARRADLMHDIIGINHNLNHYTFKLENFFSPRFAK